MGDRVLVTGGSGFLGTHLSAALLAAGYQVVAFDVDRPGPLFPAGAEFVLGDVRDSSALRGAAEGCQVVVGNAALVPVTRATRGLFNSANIDGCRATFEVAKEIGAYSVHISSSAIYGVPTGLPVTTATALHPFEPYGASKAEAEQVVEEARASGQVVASLRPRTLVGAGRLGIFDVIFSRVREGKRVPLFGAGRNRVQMCDVGDFCRAVIAAIELRAAGDYNVGAAKYGTAREDIEALIWHAGSGARVVPVPVWAIRAVLQPLDWVGRSPFSVWHWKSAPAPFYFDITQTREELGWEPLRSNAQTLAAAYDEYLASPQASGESAHRKPLSGLLARLLR